MNSRDGLKEELALKAFHKYGHIIAGIDKANIPNNVLQRIMNNQNACIQLTEQIPSENRALKVLLQILIYTATITKVRDVAIQKSVGEKIRILLNELISDSFKKKKFKDYCKYENYLLVIIIAWINSNINAYINTQQKDSVERCIERVKELRRVLSRLLSTRSNDSDNVAMLGEFYMARTAYVFEFENIVKKDREFTTHFLNYTEYHAIYKKVQAKITASELSQTDRECISLLFEAYECTLTYFKTPGQTKAETLNGICLKLFRSFFRRFALFSEKANFDGNSIAQQQLIPTAALSVNICQLLCMYTAPLLGLIYRNDAVQLAYALVMRPNDNSTNEIIDAIEHDECLLTYLAFHNEQAKNSLAIEKINPDLIRTRIIKLRVECAKRTKAVEAEVLAAQKELKNTPDLPPKKVKKNKVNLFAMQAIRDKLKDGITVQAEPKQRVKRPYPELKQIPALLLQKKCKTASKLAHHLRREAEAKKDMSALLEIYTALGDTNIIWAQSKGPIARKHKLEIATKYYHRSVAIINELALSDNADLSILKSIIIDSIPVLPQPTINVEKEDEKIAIKKALLSSVVNITAEEVNVEKILEPFDLPDYLQNIADHLIEAGHDVYLTGGAVRDYPNEPHDYDLVTSASIQEIQTLFPHGKLLGHQNPIVQINGHIKEIQISTLRTDIATAEIEVVEQKNIGLTLINRTKNLYEDASRRVFTCNALYYDFKNETILDYFNGLNDVADRKIVFIKDPEKTLMREPNLVFRIMRLMHNLGFILAAEHQAIIARIIFGAATAHHELMKTLNSDSYHDILAQCKKWYLLERIYKCTPSQSDFILRAWREILSRRIDNKLEISLSCVLVYAQVNEQSQLADTVTRLGIPSILRDDVILLLKIILARQDQQHDALVKMSHSAEDYQLAVKIQTIIIRAMAYNAARNFIKIGLFHDKLAWKNLKNTTVNLKAAVQQISCNENKLILNFSDESKKSESLTQALQNLDKHLLCQTQHNLTIFNFHTAEMAHAVGEFLTRRLLKN